jgi:hypothetical protein
VAAFHAGAQVGGHALLEPVLSELNREQAPRAEAQIDPEAYRCSSRLRLDVRDRERHVLLAPATATTKAREEAGAPRDPQRIRAPATEARATFESGVCTARETDAPDLTADWQIVFATAGVAGRASLTSTACRDALESVSLSTSARRMPVGASLEGAQLFVEVGARLLGFAECGGAKEVACLALDFATDSVVARRTVLAKARGHCSESSESRCRRGCFLLRGPRRVAAAAR